jgi:hypothetical protein
MYACMRVCECVCVYIYIYIYMGTYSCFCSRSEEYSWRDITTLVCICVCAMCICIYVRTCSGIPRMYCAHTCMLAYKPTNHAGAANRIRCILCIPAYIYTYIRAYKHEPRRKLPVSPTLNLYIEGIHAPICMRMHT